MASLFSRCICRSRSAHAHFHFLFLNAKAQKTLLLIIGRVGTYNSKRDKAAMCLQQAEQRVLLLGVCVSETLEAQLTVALSLYSAYSRRHGN